MIAQAFEFIVIRGTRLKFTGVQIFDRDCSAGTAHAAHLGKYLLRMFEMMEGETAHCHVKFAIRKRQLFSIVPRL